MSTTAVTWEEEDEELGVVLLVGYVFDCVGDMLVGDTLPTV